MTPSRSADPKQQPTARPPSPVRAKNDVSAVAATLQLLDEISHHRVTWGQLCDWVYVRIIAPGYMESPHEVRERSEDVRLHFPFGGEEPPRFKLQLMLEIVHRTVLHHLAKLAPPEEDDHFLHAAIHKHRIRRVTAGRQGKWVPCPEPTDTLSDWILSYLAADALTHPEEYEHDLMHCPHCGYVQLRSLSAATHTCRPPAPSASAEPLSDDRERLSEAPFGRVPHRRH